MGRAQLLAYDTAQRMLFEAVNEPDRELAQKLIKHAFATQSAGRLQAMLTLARPLLAAEHHVFDRDPFLLNLQNGTVDLRSGQLKPHRREDMLTRLSPVNHDREAGCPRWLAFLARVIPSHDLRQYLQRYVGYSLTGLTSEHSMLILWGSGRNGKSTFIETIRALAGDYAKVAAPSVFMERRDGAIPNDLAALNGARLVTASETESGRRLNAAVIKACTGGDRISARFLHKEFFEFTPVFKMWLATNHKPVVDDTSEGLWRRLKLVPFTVTIPSEEVDKELPQKLREELPGILNWAIEGALAWQREGLPDPPEVREATSQYRADEDPLGEFLEECCIFGPALEVTTAELFRAYGGWVARRGGRPLTIEAFGRLLAGRADITAKKKANRTSQRGYHGIGLRPDVSQGGGRP